MIDSLPREGVKGASPLGGTDASSQSMNKRDATCPECNAGFRRVEISSWKGDPGEYRCPVCNALIEVLDGSKEVAYRLTVVPTRQSRGEPSSGKRRRQ